MRSCDRIPVGRSLSTDYSLFRLHHFGEPFVGKGGRTDTNELYALLKAGKSDLELMDADFSAYARHRNAIADYRSYIRPERKDPLEIYLFYGAPGTGKTKFAIQQLGPDYYRLPICDKEFWLTPSACNKKMILIDEFRSNVPLANLLQILDENPIEVPKKHGYVWWLPDVIVITSNRSPWNWYKYETRDMEREALFRRFDNGGVYRFYKRPDKVPTPVRIDIENPADFSYDTPPIARQGNMVLSQGMLISDTL